MANNNHNIQHLNGTRNNQQRLVQILGRQYSASNNGKGNRVVNDSNPVVASPFSSAKPSLSHQQPAVRAGAPASNSSSSTIIDHEENDDDEYSSSGDEFPEITEEEIETWSGVEQKRLHFRTCVQRDEQLLRQVLIFKPFECKTKKERYEKWQCVTRNCDEIIKLLPDNSTLQLNFFFPKHAKRRFKVIMEAHHSLINNNKNPMFLGIYGEYGSLQGLIERAYQLYVQAGYRPGRMRAGFFSKRKRQRTESDDGGGGENDDPVLKLVTKRLKEQQDTIVKFVNEQEKRISDMLKEHQTKVKEMLNKHHQQALNAINTQKQIAKNLQKQQKALVGKAKDGSATQDELNRTCVESQEETLRQKIALLEEKLIIAQDLQQERFNALCEKLALTEQQRDASWDEMYTKWTTIQREMLLMQQQVIEQQSRTEDERMKFLRDLFNNKHN